MWYKGLKIILDALKKLQEDGTDFRLVMIGKGADSEEVQDYARSLGLEKQCLFPGPVYDREKLRAWNTRADLFLFPSTYDTNGLVVREAAACGLASMVISGSCAAEGITNGRNGYFCQENADSMYQELRKILEHPSQMKVVGQHAMDEIYLSWQESVHRAFDRYHVVIERKKEGLIPKNTQLLTDEFYKATGDMLIAMKESRLQAQSEFFQLKEDYLLAKEEMQQSFSEKKERLEQNLQEHYQKIDGYFEESKSRLNQFLQKQKETTRDYLETLERYL